MLILFHGAETQLQGGINAKGTDCVASQLQEIHATALSTHIYQLTPGSSAYKMVQGGKHVRAKLSKTLFKIS